MVEYEVVPHEGVGPIRFGMTRDEVHAEFGTPEYTSPDNREGFLEGFLIDFNSDGFVEFVELAKSNKFRALFHGKCLHEMLADDAVEYVQRYGRYDEDDPELGHSYVFLDLQLSLWRPTVPRPGQSEHDPDGRYFHAIGVAEDGYFNS